MTKPPQAHPHPPNDLIKKLGDRYEQFEFLAKGGMGAIFVSYDRVLGKQVAVKILTYKDINDKHLVRFQQEAITASKLTHPNIVNTLDFGITEANHPYLIMDFLPGVSLSDLLAKESSISLDKALTLTCQIGRAITFAHSKGVTHRDLKTSNIVVDCYPQAPEAKVIDFGLARLENQSDSTGKLTMVGSVVGSPLYMSPEQANGKLSDERSDIYSLGCILYAMIVGMAPFEGEDTLRIMQLKQHETPSLVNSLDSDFPDALVSVMAKVLAPHPADRYQT
ncbi:MAG: serine/threonine protein kinase, partial [Candidatus Obscuribacterales bacterium]|nr:serine/threonine protein kinase [Candidatus Obscuribacterales bacterium]